MARIVDITVPISAGLPVWPGDTPPKLSLLADLAKGDPCTVTRLEMVVHTGTHVDAPCHFIPGGAGVEALALDTLMGPAVVVEIPEPAEAITALMVRDLVPVDAVRVLFKSRNSKLWGQPGHAFDRGFVALTPEAARLLVERGVRLVGVDYLSVERFEEPGNATHHILLGAGVVALEGLDLRAAEPGRWTLTCLPLAISGADGAPARAVLSRDD